MDYRLNHTDTYKKLLLRLGRRNLRVPKVTRLEPARVIYQLRRIEEGKPHSARMTDVAFMAILGLVEIRQKNVLTTNAARRLLADTDHWSNTQLLMRYLRPNSDLFVYKDPREKGDDPGGA